jgi:hypothetical protein
MLLPSYPEYAKLANKKTHAPMPGFVGWRLVVVAGQSVLTDCAAGASVT